MNRRGAISTAEICCRQLLTSRRAYLWSLEDWYCCVRNRLLHTLVLVLVVCTLLFLSYKETKSKASGAIPTIAIACSISLYVESE